MAKQRQNVILAFLLFFVYLLLYILSRTILSDRYLFEWTSRHWYLGICLIAVLLVFFKKQVVAVAMTVGNLVGVLFGQTVGNYIQLENVEKITYAMSEGQKAKLHTHYGVALWLGIILVSLLTGIILQKICGKRH